ncbi:uncharacterized protein N7498_000130 [Penicillium cinerascens]|uniref:Uncharacterized protein n=1 Tax=Penicillium cinerascens TaxID=70096 RepID=A0A9W9TD11_9EURO|nr:uncharacterized protein N7498_000130 [Penicillium cinerascens]KAJ5218031.1 hypothetical protein N7498_000130 [Penicillium cinerascens]
MPSITTNEGYTFNNWGPVTATFTAPASCSTMSNIMIGSRGTIPFLMYEEQCSTTRNYDCIPTGTITPTTTYNPNPTEIYQEAYFSPGLYCPAGWATVGVAARNADSSLSVGGILTSQLAEVNTGLPHVPIFLNPATLLVELLDPKESAVMCCPRAMTADIYVGCYSTVSNYKVTKRCVDQIPGLDIGEVTKTHTWNGTAVTELLVTITATYPISIVEKTFSVASEASSLVGISVMPMITLVHHQSDAQATGRAASTSNAASRVGSRSTWNGLGAVLGIFAAAVALGASIIL